MEYTPATLDEYIIRSLYRLSETDCREAAAILAKRLETFQKADYYLTIAVDDLPLDFRCRNLLINGGLETVGSVIRLGNDRLRLIRGMGKASLRQIIDMIDLVVEHKVQVQGLSGNVLYDFLLKVQIAKNKNTG